MRGRADNRPHVNNRRPHRLFFPRQAGDEGRGPGLAAIIRNRFFKMLGILLEAA